MKLFLCLLFGIGGALWFLWTLWDIARLIRAGRRERRHSPKP